MKNLQKEKLRLENGGLASIKGGTPVGGTVYSVAYLASYGVTWFIKTAGIAYYRYYPLILR